MTAWKSLTGLPRWSDHRRCYEKELQIGSGSFGVVYQATDTDVTNCCLKSIVANSDPTEEVAKLWSEVTSLDLLQRAAQPCQAVRLRRAFFEPELGAQAQTQCRLTRCRGI